VGSEVGCAEGSGVGRGEGTGVGSGVGTEGAWVGREVGAAEGSGDGANVRTPVICEVALAARDALAARSLRPVPTGSYE